MASLPSSSVGVGAAFFAASMADLYLIRVVLVSYGLVAAL